MTDTIEFASLHSADQHRVVDSMMQLLRTMTEVYGLDKGEEIYSSIADICGADVKGAVLFAMLTGQHGAVTLHSATCVTQYVNLIRTVRNYTGLGLKEAKDICDYAKSGKATQFNVKPGDRHLFVRDMVKLGAEAS